MAAAAVGLAFLISLSSPALFKPMLLRLNVVDVPNERSSHYQPVVRGMGLAPLAATAIGLLLLQFDPLLQRDASLIMIIAIVSVAAGVLGWLEDLRGLPIVARAGGQLGLGFLGAAAIGATTLLEWWWVVALALGSAGYINVVNFMDGVNGISGLHGTLVGVVYACLGVITHETWIIPVGLIVAVAFFGFLPWNLFRGRVFLGDAGSYLLGAIIAIVAIAAIARGLPILAVVGPLTIYLADAGLTLVSRTIRGERWYESHRNHIYQRLTDLGLSHLQVSLIVTIASALTAGLGLLSTVAVPVGDGVLIASMMFVVVGYFGFAALLRRRSVKKREGTGL